MVLHVMRIVNVALNYNVGMVIVRYFFINELEDEKISGLFHTWIILSV